MGVFGRILIRFLHSDNSFGVLDGHGIHWFDGMACITDTWINVHIVCDIAERINYCYLPTDCSYQWSSVT